MSQNADKDLKNLAKAAKSRLKTGFWEEYKTNVEKHAEQAELSGCSPSNVIKYYKAKVSRDITGKNGDDSFYLKVKDILDEYGEVSDIIGRLCDADRMKTFSFQQKQRYVLEISEKYLECAERYRDEKKYGSVVEKFA